MSRALLRVSVATAVAVAGLVAAPAAADPVTLSASSAPFLVRVGDQTDGLVFHADAANPDHSFRAPVHGMGSDLQTWGVSLADVRSEVHVYSDGSAVGDAATHFALRDNEEYPFIHLNGVGGSSFCQPNGTVWKGSGGGNLNMIGRQAGEDFRVIPIVFDQPITLDPVYAGDVAFPGPDDYRLTTVTLSRLTTLDDLAGFPEFAGYSTPRNGVTGFRLTVEQRETPSSTPKTYEFLVGAAVCGR